MFLSSHPVPEVLQTKSHGAGKKHARFCPSRVEKSSAVDLSPVDVGVFLFLELLCRPPPRKQNSCFRTKQTRTCLHVSCQREYFFHAIMMARRLRRLGHEIAEEGASRWLLSTTAVPASVGDLGNKVEVNLGDYHCVGLYLLTADEVSRLVQSFVRSIVRPFRYLLLFTGSPLRFVVGAITALIFRCWFAAVFVMMVAVVAVVRAARCYLLRFCVLRL